MRNLKKIAALFVALAMVLSLVAVPVFAADTTNVKYELEFSSENVKQGGKTTLNVYLKDADDASVESIVIASGAVVIAYDTTKFDAVDKTTEKNGFGTTNVNAAQGTMSAQKSLTGADASQNVTVDTSKPILSVELTSKMSVTEITPVEFTVRSSSAAGEIPAAGGAPATLSVTNGTATVNAVASAVKYDLQFTNSAVKAGGKTTLNVYLKDAYDDVESIVIASGAVVIAYDTTKFDAVDKTTEKNGFGTTNVNAAQGTMSAQKSLTGADASQNVTVDTSKPILSVELTSKMSVDEDTPVEFTVRSSSAAGEIPAAGGAPATLNVVNGTATLTATVSFTATVATPEPTSKNYPIGTDVAAELAKDVEITVSGNGKNDPDYKATWVCEDETCDVNSIGEHIFVGTVVGPDDAKAATWEGNLTTTVTVFLEALKDGTLAEVAATEMQATKEDTDVVVEAFDLAITKGDFADAIAIAAEWIAVDNETIVTTAAATFEDAVTITIPAGTNSKEGKFIVAEETVVKGDVVITPAEFPYEEVSYEVSASGKMEESTELTVTITNNQTEENLKPEAKAVITVTLTYGEGETATFVYGDDEGEEITFDAENKEVAIELPALSDMFDLDELGLENFVGSSVSVGVTYDDADVKADAEAETPETSLEVEEDAPTSNRKPGGIGSSTRPSGNSGTVVTPGTDEPGTEEPGTDEPGTDAPVVTGTFSDVPTTHWAYEAIEALAAAGIINGVGDGTFNVDGNVTRAEFVKMLMGAMGVEATATESAFEDCAADAWYTPYVVAAAEAGYVMGMSETYFGAEELISRQDICTILGRVLAVESETAAEFTDADQIADYAVKYVNALVEMGIINGYEDGSFKPEANATRAEAAKIINGVLALVAPEAEEEAAEEEVVEEAAEEEATEEVAEEVAEEATEEEAAAEETEEAAEADAE